METQKFDIYVLDPERETYHCQAEKRDGVWITSTGKALIALKNNGVGYPILSTARYQMVYDRCRKFYWSVDSVALSKKREDLIIREVEDMLDGKFKFSWDE